MTARSRSAALALGAVLATTLLPGVANAEADPAAEAQRVLDLTNGHRAAAGCPALTLNPQLTASAQGHSEDMARHNYFSHTGKDGSSPGDRIARAGYHGRAWAENIAAGYRDSDIAVREWMNSPGHRRNILNCDLRELGVGYVSQPGTRYTRYWTQNFGSL
ncbi:CAP domain-containing protein [Allokutzneria albata]|uniref:Cysteine-rich secretory protein family protein n=1 Tax=Allokutzneria albata TaxID=211114 RepID=A0A1G9TPF5_ALLAB|nr:CAP domain-containing protein [Allokutzneria albata]SDM49314.1 Cysteine-rich secretory protein family protein [Allokutzneria albata]